MKKLLALILLLLATPAFAQSTAQPIQLGFLSTSTGICGTRPMPCWTPYSSANPMPTTGGSGGGGITALTGVVTASGTGSVVTSFGSFSSATLAAALTDETGTGAVVFAVSPTFTGTANFTALSTTGNINGNTFTGGNAIQLHIDASGNISTSGTVTAASFNGVVIGTSGSSTTYLNGAGGYTTPSGGGSPGGTSGQIQYNNAGSFGGFTVSGDGTVNTSTGAMTNTGINGIPVTTSLASGPHTITGTINTTSLNIVGATDTVSTKVLNITETWNGASTIFDAPFFMNITETAQNSTSLLADVRENGTSVFTIGEFGAVNSQQSINAIGNLTSASGGLVVSASGQLSWLARGVLTSPAAGSIQFGALDAASPVAQTLSVQNVIAGTTNTSGTNLTINGSKGTGTGNGGNIIFQTAPAGSTGTAQNPELVALDITSSSTVGIGTSLPLSTLDVRGATSTTQVIGNSSIPAITAGAAAGSGASATIATGGNNLAGVINVTTGTSTTASAVLATVTFNGTLGVAPKGCILFPQNANAVGQVAMIYTGTPTTTTWTINVAGSAIPASTNSYQWGYLCI